MNNKKIALFVILALLVGLVGGFFLYSPISDSISLNAGGPATPDSKGIWTGSEYAKPWEWSSTQWATFSTCTGNHVIRKQQWQECAARTISKSTFSGRMTATITGATKADQATASFNVSATGAISGSVTGTEGNGFPLNTMISGYISPAGEVNISVGKADLSGYVVYEGPAKSSTSKVFDGTLIDQNNPNYPIYSIVIFSS